MDECQQEHFSGDVIAKMGERADLYYAGYIFLALEVCYKKTDDVNTPSLDHPHHRHKNQSNPQGSAIALHRHH